MAENGDARAQRCVFKTGDQVRSSPAISSDGATVFVGSQDKKLYAIEASTVSQKWAFETVGGV